MIFLISLKNILELCVMFPRLDKGWSIKVEMHFSSLQAQDGLFPHIKWNKILTDAVCFKKKQVKVFWHCFGKEESECLEKKIEMSVLSLLHGKNIASFCLFFKIRRLTDSAWGNSALDASNIPTLKAVR